MSWAVGYDSNWNRDIGYGVPAWCDHPKCHAVIDRGLSYVCGDQPYGGEYGCGLYFCATHLAGLHSRCPRCRASKPPYKPKPEHPEWLRHKLTHESWAPWRSKHAKAIAAITASLGESVTEPTPSRGDS